MFVYRVVQSEELPLYPLLSMLAEAGGFLGLFLGLSFLYGVKRARWYAGGWIKESARQRRKKTIEEESKEAVMKMQIYSMVIE